MHSKRQFLMSLVGIGLGCLMLPNAVHAQSGEVRIGAIHPLTGPLSFGGTESFLGAEIARELVNEKGGVWGKKVVFVSADAPDPTAGASEANRLITREGVKLIVGTFSSGIAIPASAVAERNQVVYWENNAVVVDLTKRGFKYLFRANVSALGTGGGAVDYAAKLVAPKIGVDPKKLRLAIVYEDGAYGSSIHASAQEKAKELGIPVLAAEGYSNKVTDLSPVILRLKALNPDVIVGASVGGDAILFWKQAKELGLDVNAMIGTAAGFTLPDFVKAMGKDADGVLSSDHGTDVNPKALSPRAVELRDEFIKRVKARTGREPTSNCYLSFAGTLILLQDVLPKAGSMDPEKIREAAMSLDLPFGYAANGMGIKFAPPGDPHAGQNTRVHPVLLQWQNGRLQLVGPANMANAEPTMIPLPTWAARK